MYKIPRYVTKEVLDTKNTGGTFPHLAKSEPMLFNTPKATKGTNYIKRKSTFQRHISATSSKGHMWRMMVPIDNEYQPWSFKEFRIRWCHKTMSKNKLYRFIARSQFVFLLFYQCIIWKIYLPLSVKLPLAPGTTINASLQIIDQD